MTYNSINNHGDNNASPSEIKALVKIDEGIITV
jgi:hypothetical protein